MTMPQLYLFCFCLFLFILFLGKKFNLPSHIEGKRWFTDCYDWTGKWFRGHGMSHFSVRISTVVLLLVTLLSICYSGCVFLELDVNILFVKVKLMLLGKGLHLLFSRLEWCFGCGMAILFLLDPELGNMMVPSGASGDKGSESPGSSGVSTSLEGHAGSVESSESEE